MSTIYKTAPITELRANLPEYIDNLVKEGPLQIIRRSKPVAYVLAPIDFEKYLQQLEDLEDLKDMLEVLKDYFEGNNLEDANDVFEELGL